MLEKLGVHLPCSHVVNQIWRFAGSSYRDELSERVRLFGRYREFDKTIKNRYEGLAAYEQEIINEENVLCKTHFNIMLLEDEEAVLDRCGFRYYTVFKEDKPEPMPGLNIMCLLTKGFIISLLVRFWGVKPVWILITFSSQTFILRFA